MHRLIREIRARARQWGKIDCKRIVRVNNIDITKVLIQENVRLGMYLGICIMRTRLYTWVLIQRDCRVERKRSWMHS